MYPTEWKVCTLSDVTEKIMVGIASAATHAYCSSGIPMLRNLNIRPGYIDEQDVLQIDSQYELAHRNKRLKTGDVLVVRTGYPGVSAVVPEKYDGAQCFTSLIVRPKKTELVGDYFCQYMNSAYGERLSAAAEAGGAQKNLNAGELEKLELHLPPVQEQRSISSLLSVWDRAISVAQKVVANSQQQKLGLQQKLIGDLARTEVPSKT
jgi:type I restriction enzyme S subunit